MSHLESFLKIRVFFTLEGGYRKACFNFCISVLVPWCQAGDQSLGVTGPLLQVLFYFFFLWYIYQVFYISFTGSCSTSLMAEKSALYQRLQRTGCCNMEYCIIWGYNLQ